MMVIMLDANALVDDTRLEKATWGQLSKAIKLGTTRVVVPRIAVREAQRRYTTMRDKTATAVQQKAQSAPAVGRELIMRGVEAIKQEGLDYDPAPLLDERGATIVGAPDVDHDTVAERAVSRVRPFDEDGNGYRDTLHWYLFLHLLQAGPGDEYVLVTNDNAFYEDSTTEGRLRPHPSLMTEAAEALGLEADSPDLARRVRFRRLLGELEVPHQYEGEPYSPGYDDDFALLVMRREAAIGGALDLSPKEMGWRGWDVAEPHIVQVAEVLTAEARRLSSSTDVEVRFEVMGDVTYNLSRYEDRGEPFPEVVHEHRTSTIVMTGRAIVPAAGVEYLALNSVEARPFKLDRDNGSPWAGTFNSEAAWRLVNKQFWGEVLATTLASTKIAGGVLPLSPSAAVVEAMRSPLPAEFSPATAAGLAQRALSEQMKDLRRSAYRDTAAEAAAAARKTFGPGDALRLTGIQLAEAAAAASGSPTDTADDPDSSDDDATDEPEDDSSRE